MGYGLGVDLGTTFTCAVTAREGRTDVVQLGGTSNMIPSVVSVRDDGAILTGEAAERRAVTDPSRTVREFKRRFGDEAPYVIGGTPYGTETLVGHLLRSVLDAVTKVEGEAPARVALTHPADYGLFKLELLQHAAQLAGVREPLLVPEPVAAAIAYIDRAGVPVGAHLLVYDLGGGTFDAAVVRVDAAGPVVVGAPEGLARLGGIDFDQAVLAHVERATGGAVTALDSTDADSRAALSRLRAECRTAKEALSDDTETEIPVLLPQVRTSVRLTREELESMVAPRLTDTAHVLERVVSTAGLAMGDIATVLLVGGSSRMPAVAQLVREHTGRPVAVDTNPKTTVAAGAAVLAARGAVPGATPAPAGAASTSPATAAPPAILAPPVPDRAGAIPASATPPAASQPAAARSTTTPPTAPAAPAPGDGRRDGRGRRRGLLVGIAAAIAVVALAVGGIVALGGGSNDDADPTETAPAASGSDPSTEPAIEPTTEPGAVTEPTDGTGTTAVSGVDATAAPAEEAPVDGQSVLAELPGSVQFGDALWEVTGATSWGQGEDWVVTVDLTVTNLLADTELRIDSATELVVRLSSGEELRSAEVGGDAVMSPGGVIDTWYVFRGLPDDTRLDGASFTVESAGMVPATVTPDEFAPTPELDVAADVEVPGHGGMRWQVGAVRASLDALVNDGAAGGYTTTDRRAGDGHAWLAVDLVAIAGDSAVNISSAGTLLVVDGETVQPVNGVSATVAAGDSHAIEVGFLILNPGASTFELRLGTADDPEQVASIELDARSLLDQLAS